MALTNKYNGRCADCSTKVFAGEGVLQGPPWVTFCKSCWAKYAPSKKAMVRVDLANAKEFVVSPVGYLQGSDFSAYRNATDAADGRWDSETKRKLVPAASAQTLIAELEAAGIVVDVAPSVVAALQASIAAKKEMLEMASKHLERVEAGLVDRVLFPFQRKGIEWLAPRDSALLADEMGLGKTAQALCAMPFDAPVLIVCPVVAKGVWKAELKVWRSDYRNVSVLKGRKSFRWPEPGEVVLTNYEILSESVEKAPKGVVVIADEAHMVKNKKAKRTKAFKAVSNAAHAAHGRVWELTATPLLNTPPELWTVLDGAGLAETAFDSFKSFKKLFGYNGKPSKKLLTGLATVMLRRHRLDVLPDLPTKIRNDVVVNGLDAATTKLCDDIWEELKEMGIDLDAAVGDAEKTKLTGAAFSKLSKARAALATAKIPAMLELVEQYEDAHEPLVVFSAHRAPIDLLGKREGWEVITGDTPADERTEIEQRFQNGELAGVAATIRAGGVAITLTRSHHGLFVDQAWTPALNSQAEDRICRIGQDTGVLIKRLVASHKLDRRVNEILLEKQLLIEATVEAAAVKNSGKIEGASLESQLEKTEADVAVLAAAADKAAAAKASQPQPQTFVPKYAKKPRRQAETDAEKWAASGLIVLAQLDPDHAGVKNDVGFNGADGDFGHSLANQIAAGSGLTDGQWKAALKMLQKYHKQIGQCPV